MVTVSDKGCLAGYHLLLVIFFFPADEQSPIAGPDYGKAPINKNLSYVWTLSADIDCIAGLRPNNGAIHALFIYGHAQDVCTVTYDTPLSNGVLRPDSACSIQRKEFPKTAKG